MTLLSDYRRIKDGSARCSLRIREHILQQAPKVTYPDAYIAGVYEGLLDQALLMVDRLTGIDPEPVVDERDAEISDLKAQIADIIITEKTTCNNCGGRMFISQFSSHIMVCHGPGGNGPGCGMRHDWHGVSTSNPIQIAAPVHPLVGQVVFNEVKP